MWTTQLQAIVDHATTARLGDTAIADIEITSDDPHIVLADDQLGAFVDWCRSLAGLSITLDTIPVPGGLPGALFTARGRLGGGQPAIVGVAVDYLLIVAGHLTDGPIALGRLEHIARNQREGAPA